MFLDAQKLGYGGGAYVEGGGGGGGGGGYFSSPQVYPGGQAMVGASALMPVYPFYQYLPQSQTMGLPAHVFSPPTPGPMFSGPALITKPASLAPNSGTLSLSPASSLQYNKKLKQLDRWV